MVGPRDFTNPVCRADPRPGGELYVVMRAPDGSDYPMKGSFHQVVPDQRLVFTDQAIGPAGEIQLEGVSIVDFAADGDGTSVNVWSSAIGLVEEAPQMLAGMNEGWSQSLDRLREVLTK
ncbi:MAG: SRPBCC domain-containing protein [Sphingomonadales bacterium]